MVSRSWPYTITRGNHVLHSIGNYLFASFGNAHTSVALSWSTTLGGGGGAGVGNECGGGRALPSFHHCLFIVHNFADRVVGSNGNGAKRGMVTVFQSIDPRPYKHWPAVHSRLNCTVLCMNDRLSLIEIQIPIRPSPPDPRRVDVAGRSKAVHMT